MNRLEKLSLYFLRAIKHARILGLLAHIVTLLVAICFVRDYWYFVAVLALGDLVRLLADGAWYSTPKHDAAPSNPAKSTTAAMVAIGKVCCTLLLVVAGRTDTPGYVICLFFCLLVFVNSMEAMRRLLLTMQKFDASWLRGAGNQIGVANWLGVIRISIAVLLPYIFWAEPFGRANLYFEMVLLGECFITDALDGFIARHGHTETRAGRYLDPLADKVLFVPLAITLALMAGRFELSERQSIFGFLTIACVFIAVIRDVLFFIWFFTLRKRGPRGMRAGIVDKIRMILVCIWLGAITVAHVFNSVGNAILTNRFVSLSAVLIMLVAVVSVLSIFVDANRINKQRTANLFK